MHSTSWAFQSRWEGRCNPRMRQTVRTHSPLSCLHTSSGCGISTPIAASLGKTIQLDHKNYTIVGVAGQRFVWGDGDCVPSAENYRQIRAQTITSEYGLKPGVTHAQADAALQPLLRRVRS